MAPEGMGLREAVVGIMVQPEGGMPVGLVSCVLIKVLGLNCGFLLF